MPTFRAYLQDSTGTVTWAAWIEAADRTEAEDLARRLRPEGDLRVDPWFATDRHPAPGRLLEAV